MVPHIVVKHDANIDATKGFNEALRKVGLIDFV